MHRVVFAFLLVWPLGSSAFVPPVAAAEPWSQANGPQGNFTPLKSGAELVEDLAEAKLVWKSEDSDLGYGKGSVSGFFRHLYQREGHPGSCSGPILADGKLFVATFRPAGEVWAENQPGLDRFLANTKKPPSNEEKQKLRQNLRIAGDDLLVAIDGATGKTAWKAVEAGRGSNRYMGKRQGYCVAPAYHGGKLFSLGTLGRLYAYDAKTGEKLWETDIGRAHLEAIAHLKECLDKKVLADGSGWDVSLVVADGVLIVPTYVGGADVGLRGVNAENGKTLWEVENACSRHATPATWKHGEREYVLSATVSGTLQMIDPRSGKVLWAVDGLGENHFSLTPTAEHVFVNVGSKRPRKNGDSRLFGRLGAYALSPSGAKPVWEHPDDEPWLIPTWMDSCARRRLAVADGRLYCLVSGIQKREGRRILIVDEVTGRVLAETPCTSSAPQFYAIEDRLLVIPDASHGDSIEMVFYTTDPASFAPLADLWDPPHVGTTAYEVYMEHPYAEGRIYLRTEDGRIRCYDLRKGS